MRAGIAVVLCVFNCSCIGWAKSVLGSEAEMMLRSSLAGWEALEKKCSPWFDNSMCARSGSKSHSL